MEREEEEEETEGEMCARSVLASNTDFFKSIIQVI